MNTTTMEYPTVPGWKRTDTSRRAAQAVADDARNVKAKALAALDGKDMTGDECAEAIRPSGMDAVAFETFKRGVRSRCSQLAAAGKILDSGKRRENANGLATIVWTRSRKQGDLL